VRSIDSQLLNSSAFNNMNDPGLDEPISNDAQNVENQKRDEKEEAEEDEETFLDPRYAEQRSFPASALSLFSHYFLRGFI
jgi:hypothetical protein